MFVFIVLSHMGVLALLGFSYTIQEVWLVNLCHLFILIMLGFDVFSIARIEHKSRLAVKAFKPTTDVIKQLQQAVYIHKYLAPYILWSKWYMFLAGTVPVLSMLYLNNLTGWMVIYFIIKVFKYMTIITWRNNIISCIPCQTIIPA